MIEFSTSSTIGGSPSLQYPSVKYKFLTVDGQNPHSNQEFAVKLYDRAPQGINNIALLVDGQYKPSFSGGGGDGTEWRLTLPQGTHTIQLVGLCDYKQDGTADCSRSTTRYNLAYIDVL